MRATIARAAGALAALAAAVLLIFGDLSTLRGARALQADVLTVSAGGHHGYALLIIGLIALPLTGRAVLGSRAAALALLVLGVAGAVVVLAVDLPTLGSTAPVDQLYTSVSAWTGRAIYLEGAGSALLTAAGVLLVVAPRPRGRDRRARPRS